MVAETVTLPNIRKLFIPDDGMIIAEVDLAQADLQVVIWEADDAILKQMKREGVNIHKENAKLVFGLRNVEESADPNTPYMKAKKGVHLTNYGGAARTLAISLGITIAEAEVFQKRWFAGHPGIKVWHARTQERLNLDQEAHNRLGYRIKYFGRVDSAMFREALAWVPQSTVACVINRGLINIDKDLPWCELLLQVHDSLVLQFKPEWLQFRNQIRDACLITVPYDDPLVIPVGMKVSDKSWGDAEKIAWA